MVALAQALFCDLSERENMVSIVHVSLGIPRLPHFPCTLSVNELSTVNDLEKLDKNNEEKEKGAWE